MTKAMMSGQSPSMPMPASTTWMPTSCRAIYGMVARMPVKAIASASQEEPGDDGPEAATGQAPLVQLAQVASAPIRGQEAEDGDQDEQGGEDRQGHEIDAVHTWSSSRVAK